MFLVSSMVFLSSDTCRRNEAPQWPGNREQQLETERRASGVRWRTFLAASISISKSPPLSSLILSFIVLRPGPRALSFGFVRAKGYAAVYQARLPTRQRAFRAFDSWRTRFDLFGSGAPPPRHTLPIAVR